MNRRHLGSGEPRFDRDHTLYVLRHNRGKADEFITAAEEPYRAAGGAS